MNFETALEQELKTIAAFEGRVYPLVAKETKAKNGVPYLIYSSSEGLRTKSIGGYQTGKTVSGEINVVAARYEDIKAITASVIDLLVTMEQRTISTGGPYIQEFTYEEPVELYEEAPKLYRCLIDYDVYF